jgi:BirA family transcriptional regulator, biotin operon repressor / biotin---[acetyl-CoA-carboxylase] ligase
LIAALHIELLRALVTQGTQSGAALAERLGVTRARVSQLVRDLNVSGATIASGRSGYAAAFPSAMLDGQQCAAGTGWAVSVEPILESTNASLLQRGLVAGQRPPALLTEWQTGGRGRRGRAWASAPGGSVLLSVGWQFAGGAAMLAGLSLVVGIAIVDALAQCGATDLKLKWPNDVLWHGLKCGGVLIELGGDALGPTTAVIGIGLNVHLPERAREAIDQAVTDLSHSAPQVRWDRNDLCNALLTGLASTLARFASEGFAPFAARWHALHAHQGASVRAILPDGRALDGIATGVNASGALMLQTAGMNYTLTSADISLRAQQKR